MKLNVARRLCLIAITAIVAQGCGIVKESLFNLTPSIIFNSPTATIYTQVNTFIFSWSSFDAFGQLRLATKPYQVILFSGMNCSGSILTTTSSLATTFTFSAMTSGNNYSLLVSGVYDDAGDSVNSCSSTVHMDNQVPLAVTFTAPGVPTYDKTGGPINFVWTSPVDPGGSGVSYYIVNGYGTNNCTGGAILGPSVFGGTTFSTFTGFVDGTNYSMDVTPVDNAGNVGPTTCSSVFGRYVFEDQTNPNLNCNNMVGWHTAASMPLLLSSTCTDPGGSGCSAGTLQCQYSSDNGTTFGGWGACTLAWADSQAAFGSTSQFRVRESDLAGNQTTNGTCTVFIDKTNPPAPTLTSTPPNPSNVNIWNFTYLSTDNESGTASYDCRIDGGGWIIGCGANYNTGALADGSHTFDVRANDVATNVSAITSYTWTIDTSPPVCTVAQFGTFDGAATFWTNNSNPTVNFNCVDGSGSVAVGTFLCSIDGGAWNPCSGLTFVYPNGTFNMGGALGAGAHTAAVEVQDASGNTGASANMNFSIDTTIPNLTCNGQTAAAWKNSSTGALLYGTCADPGGSGCDPAQTFCSFDGGTTWISCTEAIATIPEGNPVGYWVKGTDYAGNSTTLNTCQYKSDITPPVTSGSVASLCADSATNPILAGFDYDITPSSVDAISGLATLTCNGGPCTSGTPYTIAGGSTSAVVSIPVVATDIAGNSVTYNLSVYIAGSALTTTAIAPSGGGYLTTNPVLTTTLNVTDGVANNWTAGTSLQVNQDSVCASAPLGADQWTAGADTSKQKLVGNYSDDGLRQTRVQLTDACGNSTAFTGFSGITKLDWKNPVTSTCNAVCNGAGDIQVTFAAADQVAGCNPGDESGVASSQIDVVELALTSPAQPAVGVYTFPAAGLSGATYTINCYAFDNAGNDNRINDQAGTGTQFMTTPVTCP